MILRIEDNSDYMIVTLDDLMGARYFVVEKGYIIKTEFGLAFNMISFVAYDKKFVEFSEEEVFPDNPLISYGEAKKNGIYLKEKGRVLRELPCKRKIFKLFDELKK